MCMKGDDDNGHEIMIERRTDDDDSDEIMIERRRAGGGEDVPVRVRHANQQTRVDQ